MTRCKTYPIFLLSLAIGCTGGSQPAEPTKTTTPAVTDTKPADDVKPPVKPPEPQGGEFLKRAAAALADNKPADARAALDELRQLEKLTDDEQSQLAKLDAQLAAMLETENSAVREAAMARIPDFIANGQLDEATAAVESVAARQPTDKEREQLPKLRQEIERIRGAQRKLGAWMKLIGSENRSEFRAAQNALLEEPEAAVPLIIGALQESDDKQRTINLLETLRQLKKPQVTLPAMVSLFTRMDRQESWPDVIEMLGKISDDGAGAPLLKLFAEATEPAQRTAVLTALAKVSDPPTATLLTLLPQAFEDDAELPTALICLAETVRRHDQTDLVALRSIEGELTSDQAKQLAALPTRLEALRASPAPETARAAKILSVALGLLTPEPLTGVTVLNVSGEYPEGPGKAALDGVWKTTELTSMWYHPVNLESQIVLDLGSEKTVTGVILWNFNQSGAAYRGWKRAEVFVSPTPTALTPLASGIVPMAPGVVDPPDYSVLIPVPCATGRYVKLKASELWNPNAYTGLAEIQVLGF